MKETPFCSQLEIISVIVKVVAARLTNRSVIVSFSMLSKKRIYFSYHLSVDSLGFRFEILRMSPTTTDTRKLEDTSFETFD